MGLNIVQIFLKIKKKVGGLILSDFKTYLKSMVIKKSVELAQNRHIDK